MPVNPNVSTILNDRDADQLIKSCLPQLGHSLTSSCEDIYQDQDRFRSLLNQHNLGKIVLKDCKAGPVPGSTTGTITERFAAMGLATVMERSDFHPFDKSEKWIGDFSLRAYPLSTVVSCKSFTAKERLIVSGLGIELVPTIGFGWFNDPTEFHEQRCKSYLIRGFNSIYMPEHTRIAVEMGGREVLNHNGQPFLRDILDFPRDVLKSVGASGAAKGLVQTRIF
jgi:hypothetical protein